MVPWAYDELNRVVEVSDPFGRVVGYGYDAVGNRTSLTYPDGREVSYVYDAGNRMEVVTDWDLQDTTYAYDASNRLLTTNLPKLPPRGSRPAALGLAGRVGSAQLEYLLRTFLRIATGGNEQTAPVVGWIGPAAGFPNPPSPGYNSGTQRAPQGSKH